MGCLRASPAQEEIRLEKEAGEETSHTSTVQSWVLSEFEGLSEAPTRRGNSLALAQGPFIVFQEKLPSALKCFQGGMRDTPRQPQSASC